MTRLDVAPDYLRWFAKYGDLDDDERVTGFFAETEPDPDHPGCVRPAGWVLVTDRSLFHLDAEAWQVTRARCLHRLEDMSPVTTFQNGEAP